jgi:hypothetical protein
MGQDTRCVFLPNDFSRPPCDPPPYRSVILVSIHSTLRCLFPRRHSNRRTLPGVQSSHLYYRYIRLRSQQPRRNRPQPAASQRRERAACTGAAQILSERADVSGRRRRLAETSNTGAVTRTLRDRLSGAAA